jgi:Zn-finger nucleic acid-binding protein
LYAGRINVSVQCVDEAGNVARDSALFDLKIDTTPPKVTRIYLDRGQLNIITDENSQCNYLTESNDTGRMTDMCRFDFENGSSMTGSETKHSVLFDNKKTYYIKCKDDTGNVPGGCSMIARGGEVA